MKEAFRAFAGMKEQGDDALACVRAAKEAGLDTPAQVRMLRAVFGLSLAEAKEIIVKGEGWRSLDEFQEAVVLPGLKAAFGAKPDLT
ncbi:hypothetical protein WDZ92_30380 [Nostoc sp. NIES-2111]